MIPYIITVWFIFAAVLFFYLGFFMRRSNKLRCTFVGGPLDGRRMLFDHQPSGVEHVQPSGCIAVYEWDGERFVFVRFEVEEPVEDT